MLRAIAGLLIGLASVACGPAATASPSDPAPASVSAPAGTAGPSGCGADPSPAAGPVAAELSPGAALAPGRYTRGAFEPRITFEVAEGWEAVEATDDFFDIQQNVETPDAITVQFARPDAFNGPGGAPVPVTTAVAAADTIRANPALTVLGSSASRMSELDGFVVEVENPASAARPAPVLSVPSGALSIDPGRRLWIAVFDAPDGLVAIMVGGSVAKWEEALAAAEPVLETVTIGR